MSSAVENVLISMVRSIWHRFKKWRIYEFLKVYWRMEYTRRLLPNLLPDDAMAPWRKPSKSWRRAMPFTAQLMRLSYILASDIRLVWRFGKSISAAEGTVEASNTVVTTWCWWRASPDPLGVRLKVRLVVDAERWVVSTNVWCNRVCIWPTGHVFAVLSN